MNTNGFSTSKIYDFIRYKPVQTAVGILLALAYYFCLPTPLFKDPTATVIEANDGTLLGAKIATDGQWRFPQMDSVPPKFETCILAFEDQQFYKHPGFNPVTIAGALFENIASGKVVRGGSTLTQQVIRLSRKQQKRTYWEKAKELILATRLELRHSKKNILNLYASHAPFGGNVVGLDMAAWRYFGLPATQLSWAESATLAVLPNAPSLIYPGKNQAQLLRKRNMLLNILLEQNKLSELDYELALQEELPQRPFALPRTAPHLLDYISQNHNGQRTQTTLQPELQRQVNAIVERHYRIQKQNEVHNMAVLVLDLNTRNVLSYVGNTSTNKEHQKDVDIIHAQRSTGSTLKPLLYATSLDKGELLPKQLVADIPTVIAGYQPTNYDETYTGAVAADRALARSLNIPAVRLLRHFGLERFRDELNTYGIKGLRYGADHYGLSLIVGGAEGSLWDLCKTYAGLGSTLKHYRTAENRYYQNEFVDPNVFARVNVAFGKSVNQKPHLGAGSIWLTFEAMKNLNRPEGDEAWEFYDSSRPVAWKTGTSFGNRDAWAIGVTRNHVVGVWVGNADGEGRPELTGLHSAAPVLFDVVNLLPRSEWFNTPYEDLDTVTTCSQSGYIATPNCPKQDQTVAYVKREYTNCPYHRQIHLSPDRKYQVNSSCESIANLIHTSWFVLPPLQAFYYQKNHADYRPLPPYRSDCRQEKLAAMDFIVPKNNSVVYVPQGIDGKKQEVILEIAHTQPESQVFWYINDTYLGMTQQFHSMAIQPDPGLYRITVLDQEGNEIHRTIEIRE